MIYIYLSTETYNPASIIIRYGTHFEYSHAGFFNDEDNSYLSAQLTGGVKIRYTPEEKFTKRVLYTAPGITQAYECAKKQIGQKYDWRAILGIASDHDWHEKEDWFCSELVAYAFEEVGNPLLNPNTVVWRITPRDLTLSPLVTKITT